MSTFINTGCRDLIDKFGDHQKFENSTKRLLEEQSCRFKVVRNTFRFAFDIVEIANIFPVDYIPVLSAVKGCINVIFEVGNITTKAMRIAECKTQQRECAKKIQKWIDKEGFIKRVEEGNIQELHLLKAKYQTKMGLMSDDSKDYQITSEQAERWSECVELIDGALNSDIGEGVPELVKLLQDRKESKIQSLKDKEIKLESEVDKSMMKVIVTVAEIVLYSLYFIAAAFSIMDCGISLSLAILIGNVCVSSMSLGQYIWWNVKTGQDSSVTTTRSIEKVMVTAAKTGLLSAIPFFQSSLIRAAFSTGFAIKSLFKSYEFLRHCSENIKDCDQKIRKLETKNRMFKTLQIEADVQLLNRKLEDYKRKLENVKANITALKAAVNADNSEVDRDQLESQIGIMKGKVSLWESYLKCLEKAEQTARPKDVTGAIDKIAYRTRYKLSNWKLQKHLHKNHLLKTSLFTAVSVAEVARFIFLSTVVTLSVIGFGVNMLPVLIGTAFVINGLYLAYMFAAEHVNKKIAKINNVWARDEIVDFSQLPTGLIAS